MKRVLHDSVRISLVYLCKNGVCSIIGESRQKHKFRAFARSEARASRSIIGQTIPCTLTSGCEKNVHLEAPAFDNLGARAAPDW